MLSISILVRVKEISKEFGVPVITDIHAPEQAKPVSQVADIIQIPAFLCRQTDLIVAAGETDCWVNVKKGQFLSYREVANIKDKCPNNKKFMITERGTTFGYNNLVVDMRGVHHMREHCTCTGQSRGQSKSSESSESSSS